MGDAVHTCKNCSNQYTGTFCNQCGQKTAHRLDIKHIIHEVIHVFTHTDRSIFSLIPKILFQSGNVALDYVQGRRKRHFNIFQYLLIVVGIVTFIVAQSDYIKDSLESMNILDTQPTSGRMATAEKEITGLVQKYTNLVLVAFLPIFSLFSWLFFKSRGYNYVENLVLQVAIQSQINTYSLFLVFPLILFLPKDQHFIVPGIILTILIVANTLAYRQFYKVSWAHAFLKGIAIYICTNLAEVLVIALLFAAIIQKK